MNKSFSQRLATSLANSFLLKSGKTLHEKYINDWQLGGSFLQKLLANVYLILNDYGTGDFPPKLTSREATFESEREQLKKMSAYTLEENLDGAMRKPFDHAFYKYYLWAFGQVVDELEKRGVKPGSRLLELGCGFGWLTEMLAIRGYAIVGTTISPLDVEYANHRVESIKAKKIKCDLKFLVSPMEELHKLMSTEKPFDGAFVYEALHHAFDWRESLESTTRCIKPGGHLFIFNEPPHLHTFVCYRSSKILKTHEIGFKLNEMVSHLKKLGYTDIDVSFPVPGGWWERLLPFSVEHGSIISRAIWISAKKS